MPIRNLQDKIVFITGAASGIGRATALAFAAEGAHVVAADLNAEALGALQADIAVFGRRYLACVLNVADLQAVQRCAQQVQHQMGVPDVLISNAGAAYYGDFFGDDLAHWQRMFEVNLMGAVHLTRCFVPMMRAAGGARQVLVVASGAANFPTSPAVAAYAASKAAVANFCESLKMALMGSTVHVTTVCPGVINTPMIGNPANIGPGVSAEKVARLNAYHQRAGCAPARVAADMVRAVKRDSDILLTGPGAAAGYHLKRLSVSLLRKLMLRFARRSGFL